MKFAVLLACLLLVPLVSVWLRASRRSVPWVAFAVGFLPFVINSWRLYSSLVSQAYWPGWPKGMELTALDFVCLAVVTTLPYRPGFKKLLPWFLYLGAVAISVPLARDKVPALFYLWQVIRMILVFTAAAQLARVPKAAEQMLHGVVAGVLFQTYFAISQYLHGVAQPGGAFGAQNLLGLMSNFALVPSIVLLMVQRRPFWAAAGVVGALLLDFLTASRATLGLAAIGITGTLLFSCAKGMTARKGAVLVGLLVVSAAIAPLAWHSLQERRGADNVDSSNSERAAFKRAAWMMIADYPFGVGPSQYILVANVGGYSQRAGVNWSGGSRTTSVHNSYLLVWAETGLLGMLTMALLLWTPVVRGIAAAFRFRSDPRSETLLGFSMALMLFGIHLLFEWAWVLFITQYMFAVYGGATMGMTAELRAGAAPVSRRRTAPAAVPLTAP